MSTPFAVPDDDCTPYPLTFERLMSTLTSMGFAADVLVEGRAAGAVFDTVPFLLSIDQTGRFLSVRAVWETELDPHTAAQPLFAAADGWNREKYFPTVYSMPAEDQSLDVLADFVVGIDQGISKDQLTQNIAAGVSTCIDAIGYMKEAAAQTLGWTDPRS